MFHSMTSSTKIPFIFCSEFQSNSHSDEKRHSRRHRRHHRRQERRLPPHRRHRRERRSLSAQRYVETLIVVDKSMMDYYKKTAEGTVRSVER